MANETITGCYDKTTGEVTFDQTGTWGTCEYSGCYVASGGNFGQIAVTIDNRNYDDVYYACYDVDNGNFSVSVPDDACDCNCICGDCNSDCAQPANFSIFITSLSACSDIDCQLYNGRYRVVTITSGGNIASATIAGTNGFSCGVNPGCQWGKTGISTGWSMTHTGCASSDCASGCLTSGGWGLRAGIKMSFSGGYRTMTLDVALVATTGLLFVGRIFSGNVAEAGATCDDSATITNNQASCTGFFGCGNTDALVIASGGSATLTPSGDACL